MQIPFHFDLQRHKGGSTTVNNSSTYTPSEYELQLQKAQAKYADAIAPNALWLNDVARNILENSIGAVQVDFNGLNNQQQQTIQNAQQGLNNLAAGQLPQEYLNNMLRTVKSGVQQSYGTLLNDTAKNGVINSSVMTQGLNDIDKNVSDTMANSFTNNMVHYRTYTTIKLIRRQPERQQLLPIRKRPSSRH